MDRLLNWLDWPIKILLWVSLGFGTLMMTHIALDVAGRVIFSHPFSGTTEWVSAYYMVAVAYLPLAYIARNDDHIVVELFTRKMKPGNLLRLDTLVKIVTACYLGFFAWQTMIEALEEMHANEVWETATGFLPVWPSRWLLPVATGAMALFLVLRVLRDIGRMLRERQNREEA